MLIALFEAVRKQTVDFKYGKNPKVRVAWLENKNQELKTIIADGSSWSTSTRRTSSTVIRSWSLV